MIRENMYGIDGTVYEDLYMVTESEDRTRMQELQRAFLLDHGKKFLKLASEADKHFQEIEPGRYEIEIAKVLLVSLFRSEEEPECSNVVVVRDTEKRVWIIPEGHGALKSRWDVHAGMRLKLVVQNS